MKKNIKRVILLLLIIPILFSMMFLAFGILDNKLGTTTYEYINEKIPKDFNHYSIVQLSDLHCSYFGQEQEELVQAVSELEPDLILLTGDMIDRKNIDYNSVTILFEQLTLLAPVYAINGNHELDSTTIRDKMDQLYKTNNITLIDNESALISKGNSSIQIAGLKHWGSNSCKWTPYYVESNIPPLEESTFGILLNHRSDMLSYLSQTNYSLVLSGHTHGGIIRLPYVGGLLNNDTTLFPTYDSGVFIQNKMTLMVSRGLGNSNLIPRVYNPPEIVHVILKTK